MIDTKRAGKSIFWRKKSERYPREYERPSSFSPSSCSMSKFLLELDPVKFDFFSLCAQGMTAEDEEGKKCVQNISSHFICCLFCFFFHYQKKLNKFQIFRFFEFSPWVAGECIGGSAQLKKKTENLICNKVRQ